MSHKKKKSGPKPKAPEDYKRGCVYLKSKNYCQRADMDCNPHSPKCQQYVKAYTHPVSTGTSAGIEPNRKVLRTDKDIIIPNAKCKRIKYTNTEPTIVVYHGYFSNDKRKIVNQIHLKRVMADLRENDIQAYAELFNLADYLLTILNIFTNTYFDMYVTGYLSGDRYYISDTEYKKYLSKGFSPKANIKYINRTGGRGDFENFSEYSILALYGYRVGRTNGISVEKRHAIIDFVIASEKETARNVISSLQNNINLRKDSYKDYSYSISNWENDIDYIHKHMKDKFASNSGYVLII